MNQKDLEIGQLKQSTLEQDKKHLELEDLLYKTKMEHKCSIQSI